MAATRLPPPVEAHWQVTLPSWRLDLEREIDLIEEVARVYGYNRFANTLPAFGRSLRALPWAASEPAVRTHARSQPDSTKPSPAPSARLAEAALTAPQPGLIVPLGNPLSEEAGVMRPSLVPGMLTMIAGNLHRDVSDVRLFELGTVFSGTTEKVDERPALCLRRRWRFCPSRAHSTRRAPSTSTTSRASSSSFSPASRSASVYFDRFPPECRNHARRGCIPIAPPASLSMAHRRLVRPAASPLASVRKLKDRVLVGEIYLDRLYKLPLRKPAASEISRFQPVRRDFSLIVPASTQWARFDQSIAALHLPELIDWQVRELFRDPQTQKRVLALGRRDFSGPRPHPPRRRAPKLLRATRPGPCLRWCQAADLTTFTTHFALYFIVKAVKLLKEARQMSELIFGEESSATKLEEPITKQSTKTLGLSMDEFSALEERIVRAVTLVRRERQARAAAEEAPTSSKPNSTRPIQSSTTCMRN